ncbi:NAD-dependent epimerase/dehydratase family protein [Actinomadura fulvescens]|uniref:NAD-dependent epimerase/dehydratase family protein n=1 Tax=Actinomadura fulvescens TaxID=46160 RepID=A0ABP6C2A8_9ACTN
MTRILLIGANGFIGRHVRERAAQFGIEVAEASRAPRPGGLRLDLAAGWEPVATAIRATAPDAVVNCAGATAGDVGTMVGGNVVAVAHLVRAAAACGHPFRLVHLGSAAEYGEVVRGVPVAETAPPRPLAAYGVTKLAGTELVRAAAASGLDAVVLRVFNPVGPGAPATTLAGRLAAELRRTAGTDGTVRLGSLDAYRDLVDVRDVAAAVLAAVRAPAPPPAVLNVGSGRATQLRELVGSLIRAAGSSARVTETAPGANPGRSSGVAWQRADIGAIRWALGWTPAIGLDASMRDLWNEVGCPV